MVPAIIMPVQFRHETFKSYSSVTSPSLSFSLFPAPLPLYFDSVVLNR
jgi:hypothetical protein